MTTMARRLRERLSQPEFLVVPGAYDCLSAQILQRAGFECVYMTGYGVSASLLGLPDAGITTRAEMVEQARRIVLAIDVPLICDADEGYGNPVGVARTVREFETAGVAAIQIEDQSAPKRCGQFEGHHLVTREEMVQKIRAATDARRDPDFVIIARTDARAPVSLEDAIERGRAYYEAGADLVFVESPFSIEEAEIVARELKGIPLVWDSATGRTSDGGKTPWVGADELAEMGWKLALFPIQTLLAAAQTLTKVSEEMFRTKSFQGCLDSMMSFSEFGDLIGLTDIPRLEEKYAAS